METLDPSPFLFLTLFPEAMDDSLYLRLQSLSSGLALLQVAGNLIRLNYFPGPQSRLDKRVQGSRKAGAFPMPGCGNLEAHQAQTLQPRVISL